MGKKECFDDVIRLFKGYENTKKSLDSEYERALNSGMYSAPYLNGIAAENEKKLMAEKNRIFSRIEQIREKLEKELDKEFDLTATKPDSALVSLVNSGIVPTGKEFVNLAQKYKGNYVNSRLLHDFADRNGFILRNIATREEAEQAFNNFVDKVTSSIQYPAYPVYPDSGYAKIKADSYLNGLENPVMDCYRKPATFEEAIAQELEKEIAEKTHKSIDLDDREAFLRGFWGKKIGEKPEDVKTEEEEVFEDCVKALTEEEKADAVHMSKYFGNEGKITQRELDYLKSDDYKKAVEERNAKNGKNNG